MWLQKKNYHKILIFIRKNTVETAFFALNCKNASLIGKNYEEIRKKLSYFGDIGEIPHGQKNT